MFGFKLVRTLNNHDKIRLFRKRIDKLAECFPFRLLGTKTYIKGVLMSEKLAMSVTESEFNCLRDYLMAMREDEKRIKGG